MELTVESAANRLSVACEIGKDLGVLAYGLENNPDELWIRETIKQLREFRDVLLTMPKAEFSVSEYAKLYARPDKFFKTGSIG